MKKTLITSALLLAVGSTAASASTSINFRHEFMPEREGDKHRDRVLVSHRAQNGLGMSMETKWNWNGINDNRFISEVGVAEVELGVNYNFKLTDNFTLQPAYALDMGESKRTHKFNLRGMTKLTDNWGTSLRYRYGLSQIEGQNDDYYHQINFVTDYALSWGKVGMDYEWKNMEAKEGGWKDKGKDHLLNFFGEYSGFSSGWIPFMEVGALTFDTDDSGVKEGYSIRYRVGVKYNF